MKILYSVLLFFCSSFATHAEDTGSTCSALQPKVMYEQIFDHGFYAMLLSHLDKEQLIARAANTTLTKQQTQLFNTAVEVVLSQLERENLHLVQTESIFYHNTLVTGNEAKMFLSYDRFDTHDGHTMTLYVNLETCRVVDFIFGFYKKLASEEVLRLIRMQ